MNRKLISYRKQLEDEILENNNKSYEHRKAMHSHERKSKEAQEILDILDKGKKFIDYENNGQELSQEILEMLRKGVINNWTSYLK